MGRNHQTGVLPRPTGGLALRVPVVGTSVFIVQHGEKERLPGDPGLTAAGRSQAAFTAAYLAGLDVSVSSVYASPLRRAQETATPIASALGLSLHTDDRLRER